jgi:1,2-diacylglycerol 3-beta-galactosyltransferase
VVLTERAVYPWVRPHVVQPLLENAGDMVISVHPIQTGIALRILRSTGSRAPFATVVTDPVSPPLAWLCPDVDLCLVATESARCVAQKAGVPAGKVHVTGLPVRSSFAEANTISKTEARTRLGLRPDLPLVLLAGGGAGIGSLADLTRALASGFRAANIQAQLAVLTGNNGALRNSLETERWSLPVHVLGFVADPALWFAAASLLLTKAGPSTICEAASAGLPMILTGFIPGQEAPNVAWVEEAGAGVFAPDPIGAAKTAAYWLRGGAQVLEPIGDRAHSLVRPDAAAEVVKLSLSLLDQHYVT